MNNASAVLLKGAKCELKVKNGAIYEGVFKTYGPEVRFTPSVMVFIGANMKLDFTFFPIGTND